MKKKYFFDYIAVQVEAIRYTLYTLLLASENPFKILLSYNKWLLQVNKSTVWLIVLYPSEENYKKRKKVNR